MIMFMNEKEHGKFLNEKEHRFKYLTFKDSKGQIKFVFILHLNTVFFNLV